MHKVLLLAAFAVLASAETMDSDGITDWWEATRGLCCTNAMDAFEDPDGDWLINLHEYWHDLDPFVLDGTNTVLSILARSIDDRIAGNNPATALPIYENYLANATRAPGHDECLAFWV